MSNASSISTNLAYVQQQLIRYVYSTYLAFGIVGCTLNIILFSRHQYRSSSCGTYFLAMSMAMILHITIGPSSALYSINHGDPTSTVLVWCKLRLYLLQSTSMMYRWSLTAACFDRFALSSANVHLRDVAKPHVARRVILAIVCAWIILPVHTLILYNIRGVVCGVVYSTAGAFYHSIFTTTMAGVLPSTIMIVCAILLYRNLQQKQERRKNNVNPLHNNGNKTKLEMKRDQQILIMLIFQVLIYLILMSPLMCTYFYNAITLSIMNKSTDRIAVERFVLFMAELTIFLFPVLSFYIHTMVSRMFRKEILNIICYIVTGKTPKFSSRVGSITNKNGMVTLTANAYKSSAVFDLNVLKQEKNIDGTDA